MFEYFFDLYLQNATILSIKYEERSNRSYPSVTFCPEEILKENGVPISKAEFDRLSYTMVIFQYLHPVCKLDKISFHVILQHDIFHNLTIQEFKRNDLWSFSVMDGPYVGTCYTIRWLNEAKPFGLDFSFLLSC